MTSKLLVLAAPIFLELLLVAVDTMLVQSFETASFTKFNNVFEALKTLIASLSVFSVSHAVLVALKF